MISARSARRVVLGLSLIASPYAASAQITVHTTQAPFMAATSNRATDSFNDLTQTLFTSPLFRTAGVYAYRASATGGFYPSGNAADTWLAADAATDVITLSNFSPTVRGVGGFFFGTDINTAFLSGISVIVTATSGTFTETRTLPATTLSTFLGFTSVGALTSITIQAVQPTTGDFAWASVNNLTLGEANTVVPEPSTAVLMGSAMLALAAFRVRRRQ